MFPLLHLLSLFLFLPVALGQGITATIRECVEDENAGTKHCTTIVTVIGTATPMDTLANEPPKQTPHRPPPSPTQAPKDTHSEHAPSPTNTLRTPTAPTHSPSPGQTAPTNGNDQNRGISSSSTNSDTTSSSRGGSEDPKISTIFGGVETATLSDANPGPSGASLARQHGISSAVIIAVVLGCIVAVMLVALLVFFYVRRRGRHRSRLRSPSQSGQSETSQRGTYPIVPFPLGPGQDARCISGEDPGRSKSNLSLPLLNPPSGSAQPAPATTPRRKNTLIRRVFRAMRIGDRSGHPEPFYVASPPDNPPSYRQEDAISSYPDAPPSYHRRQTSGAPPSYHGREKGDPRRSLAPPLPTNRTM